METRNLYLVTTKSLVHFHVVATSFDKAAQMVTDELNKLDYGYSSDRDIVEVKLICREEFAHDGKRKLYSSDDRNHLITTEATTIQDMERAYAERLQSLEEENAKLKDELQDFRERYQETFR